MPRRSQAGERRLKQPRCHMNSILIRWKTLRPAFTLSLPQNLGSDRSSEPRRRHPPFSRLLLVRPSRSSILRTSQTRRHVPPSPVLSCLQPPGLEYLQHQNPLPLAALSGPFPHAESVSRRDTKGGPESGKIRVTHRGIIGSAASINKISRFPNESKRRLPSEEMATTKRTTCRRVLAHCPVNTRTAFSSGIIGT